MPATSTHAGTRRGRRLRGAAAGALVVILALLTLLRGHGRFDASVVNASGDRVYVAREGQRVRLRFVDERRAGTPYKVAASTGSTTYALGGTTGRRGAASLLMLPDIGPPARVSVRWNVDGQTVARWMFLARPSKRAG